MKDALDFAKVVLVLFALMLFALSLGACSRACANASDCQARCEMTTYPAVGRASGRCRFE